MIKVTKAAVEEFNKMAQIAKEPEKKMLRVSFGGYGWGGPRFNLTLDELIDKTDLVEEASGIKVVYAAELEDYLNGTIIDYSKNWFSSGFTINGGSTSSCWS